MTVIHTSNPRETQEFAAKFASELNPGDVIAYIGGLGAGKTTFTRGLAQGLGIEEHVASPTFALLNEYRGGRLNLYHFDMYRVLDFESLCSTGFFDYLESDGVLAIEWSENIKDELPENTIYITLERDGSEESHRKITIDRR